MFKFLIILLCLEVVWSHPDNRIVNGTPATKDEFPFMVSIRSRRNTHDCGGTIIDSMTILTAGHCVCGYTDPLPNIQYGVKTISLDGPTIIQMKKIICHEEYTVYGNDYAHNDIALVKLVSPMDLGIYARSVSLPPKGYEVTSGIPATLLGWGLNETNGMVQANLQKVNIEIISDDFCKSAYPDKIIESNVCAGLEQGGKGQCSGDSGGPLLVDGYQVGIVSWSEKPCAAASQPGVFTKISSFLDWINNNM